MKPLWIAVAATLLAAAGAILVGKGRSGQEASDRIALGRAVYLANCASCHGTKLEGQPDWRSPARAAAFRRRRMTRPVTPGIIRTGSSSQSSPMGPPRWLAVATRVTCPAFGRL